MMMQSMLLVECLFNCRGYDGGLILPVITKLLIREVARHDIQYIVESPRLWIDDLDIQKRRVLELQDRMFLSRSRGITTVLSVAISNTAFAFAFPASVLSQESMGSARILHSVFISIFTCKFMRIMILGYLTLTSKLT